MSATVIPTESREEASGCADAPVAARTATINSRKRGAGPFAFTDIRIILSVARDLLSSEGSRSFAASLLRMTRDVASLLRACPEHYEGMTGDVASPERLTPTSPSSGRPHAERWR